MTEPIFVTHVISDELLVSVRNIDELQFHIRQQMINELLSELPLETEGVYLRFYPPETQKVTFTTRYFASADTKLVQELEDEIERLNELIRILR